MRLSSRKQDDVFYGHIEQNNHTDNRPKPDFSVVIFIVIYDFHVRSTLAPLFHRLGNRCTGSQLEVQDSLIHKPAHIDCGMRDSYKWHSIEFVAVCSCHSS